MFSSSVRRLAEAPKIIPKLNIYNNPYKKKKDWPPDFSKLPTKYQFRLERRYKRRSKLKWARPGWSKGVKLVSQGLCTFVVVYGVLFMDWTSTTGKEEQPFMEIRNWFWKQVGLIWTTQSVELRPSTEASPKGETSR